jgi:hypothetical protein
MDIDPKKLFFPNKAIRQENKQFFAGRRDLLRDACLRVGRDDFSALVYGDRGVGKTSFGWQLLELLSGDRTLAESGDLNLPANLSECKCVWLQCQDYMQNIEGVLLSLLKNSLREHSFAQEFPKVYENEEFKDKIERKYQINLSVVSTEFLFKGGDKPDKSEKANVQDLFRDIIDACKHFYPDQSIIIFLDEFDSLPDRSRVGELIHATDDARFVIIGIADNVDEIIEDHQSAARKLADSKFRIPRFKAEEINFIFDKAEEVANHQIIFDQKFREEVKFRAYGYPFLVQRFGFFATQLILDSSQEIRYPLSIGVADLQSAIDRLFKDAEENRLYKSLFEILQEDRQAKKEILRIVAQETDYISVENIRNKISGRLKLHVEQNVKSLIEIKVLNRVEGNRVRFRDPEARILTQVYFDSQPKS